MNNTTTRRLEQNSERGNSVHVYESLDEWYRAADQYKQRRFKEISQASEDFLGASLADIKSRMYGYSDAVEHIAELPEMTEPIRAAEYHKTWNEVDGDDMDMDRFMNGMPFIRRRVKDRGRRKTAGTVAIFVNIAEHCGIDQTSMRCKAYAAARIADQIEAAGTRVEVHGVIIVRRAKYDGSSIVIQIRIKSAAEPLNLSAIVAALMPWQLRYWYFRFAASRWVPGRGYGSPDRIQRDDPTAIYIDTGDCLTMDSARKFVRNVEEAMQAGTGAI